MAHPVCKLFQPAAPGHSYNAQNRYTHSAGRKPQKGRQRMRSRLCAEKGGKDQIPGSKKHGEQGDPHQYPIF